MHINQHRRMEIMEWTLTAREAIDRHGRDAAAAGRKAEVNAMDRLGEGIAQMALELTSTLTQVTA